MRQRKNEKGLEDEEKQNRLYRVAIGFGVGNWVNDRTDCSGAIFERCLLVSVEKLRRAATALVSRCVLCVVMVGVFIVVLVLWVRLEPLWMPYNSKISTDV